MIGPAITNLTAINNPLAENLLALLNNTLPAVEESFYESTIFGSKSEYTKQVFQIKNAFVANFGKNLVETPLTFVRGNIGAVWSAVPGKGILTGVMLFHYITKQPLFLATVDQESAAYKYESAKYNRDTMEFDSLTSESHAATSIEELVEFISEKVSTDILTFTA
jgi:hypothetical protein